MKRLWSLLLVLVLTLALALPAAARDTIPPVLHRFQLDTTSVIPGGSVFLTAEADDNDFGVRVINAVFQHETTARQLTADLREDPDGGIGADYSGKLFVPLDADLGVYKLMRVTVTDHQSNKQEYIAGLESVTGTRSRQPLEWELSFTVSQKGATPVPADCTVTQENGVYTLRLQLADAPARMEKTTLLFQNTESDRQITVTLTDEDRGADGSYSQALRISSSEPKGIFNLKRMEVTDKEGNRRSWVHTPMKEDLDALLLPFSTTFILHEVQDDTTPPALLSITMGAGRKERGSRSAKYALTARVIDDLSGVDTVTVKFKHQYNSEFLTRTLTAADLTDGGLYTGDLTIKADQPPGRYDLYTVTVTDKAGNSIGYYRTENLTDSRRLLPNALTIYVDV